MAGPGHDFGCGQGLAVPVDISAKPLEQGLELPALEMAFERAEFPLSRIKQLAGVERAERVGRKIAKQSRAPVDILQCSFRVISGAQTEISVVLV